LLTDVRGDGLGVGRKKEKGKMRKKGGVCLTGVVVGIVVGVIVGVVVGVVVGIIVVVVVVVKH